MLLCWISKGIHNATFSKKIKHTRKKITTTHRPHSLIFHHTNPMTNSCRTSISSRPNIESFPSSHPLFLPSAGNNEYLLFNYYPKIIFNLMSKINSDFLKKTISELLATRKQRKFVETVELQIGLRDYDPDKRFNGTVRLPHKAYNNIRVCVLANAAHIEEATANGIAYIDVDGLKAFNKDKTKIKKWAKKYDVLLASDSVAKQTTKLLGNVLVKMNRFPVTLAEGEKITAKIDELKHTVKFQSKKASCLGTAIGNVEASEDNIRQNLTMSINFLVSLMKKGWQNVGTLHIKTSMGKSFRIFG